MTNSRFAFRWPTATLVVGLAVAVTWGFNSRESLAREGPSFLVEHPRELLDVV